MNWTRVDAENPCLIAWHGRVSEHLCMEPRGHRGCCRCPCGSKRGRAYRLGWNIVKRIKGATK